MTTRTRSTTDDTPPVPHQPVGTHDERPLYASGEVPDDLMTAAQLKEAGRRLTKGQKPRAYLKYKPRHGKGPVPLYHVEDTERARALSPKQTAQKVARRKCILCTQVADAPLWERTRKESPWLAADGRICQQCSDGAHEQWQRTCDRCRTIFRSRASVDYSRTCGPCRAVLDHGQDLARRLALRHCPECLTQTATREQIEAAAADDLPHRLYARYPRTCGPCQTEQKKAAEEADRAYERERWDELGPVRQWARQVVAAPERYAVLDTETTGLEWDAKVVEISVTDGAGNVLLNTLVNPRTPIPREAQSIHGISDDDVRDALSFSMILPELTRVLAGRRIIIYNAEYDTRVLAHELTRHHQEDDPIPALRRMERHPAAEEWMRKQQWSRCAMLAYAVHRGEWSDYWDGWAWAPLNGGHRALGDCRKVVQRIKEMAAPPDPF
ncbi:3'-5' exonuclease [Streptomyces yaizuensis]|uniref:3'-5' exonuclease n=1 Tax=Streptomyces yaizuensis TaxID=2989713 RepID=A0AA86MGB7_9ACTN|nr:3'-5' exonuclease [Streptomyces sp. YSPA8]BDT39684.1 3'-5' exonuclease [Streptomyces sp. YSPA8]